MNTVKTRAGSGHTDKDKKSDPVTKTTRRTSTPPIADKKDDNKDKHLRKTDSPSKMTSRRTSTPAAADKKDETKDKDKSVRKTASPSKSRRISTPVGDKEKKEEPKEKQLKVDEPTAQSNGSDNKTDLQNNQPIPIVVIDDISAEPPVIVVDDDVVPTVTLGPEVPSTNGDHSLPIIVEENDNDDLFPELKYEEGSDDDDSELVSDIRSSTRRSQVQVTRTPETPRPGSDKQTDKKENGDDKGADAKDTRSAKGKEDAMNTGRKLRSADKIMEKENGDHDEGLDGRRETNFSKSRVKVSPYRRAALDSSTTANYTGNNTTMEMDITESSIVSETSNNSSVRGRKSYKSLKPVKFERPPTSAVTVVNTSAGKRLCGAVVGRKRKPDSPEAPELLPEGPVQHSVRAAQLPEPTHTPEVKRQRRHLLDRVFSPFVAVSSTPEPRRKNAQIVGINSDLPLSSPLVTTDPEVIKVQPEVEVKMADVEVGTEARPANRRCVVM